MSFDEITCREVVVQLPVDASAAPAVRAHVAGCEDCRAVAERLDAMFVARRQHADRDPPPFAEGRILARTRAHRPQRSRWRFAIPALAVSIAAVALVVWLRPAPTPSVRLTAQRGEIVATPSTMAVGTVLETGNGGRALVELPRSRVAALGSTSVRVDTATVADVRLTVARGGLVADVDPSSTEPRRFVVALPEVEVTVTGTRFLAMSLGGRARVAVERGHVIVTAGQRTVALDAGELLEIGPSGVVSKRALADGESQGINAALRAADWSGADVESLGHLEQPRTGEGLPTTPADLPEPPPSRERHPAHKAKVRAPRPKGPVANPELDRVRAAVEARDCDGASTLAVPLKVSGDEPSRVWFAIAQCFHAAERDAEAAAAYGEVVRRFPYAAVSEHASYEVARLSRVLGRSRIAESAFTDYLLKYPNGALAEEATFWRCHLAAANDHPDDAVTCLRGFRERFAKSPRATETYFSEATLLRAAKRDCPAAIVAYRAYLDIGGVNRDQAKRWKEWCEAKR